MVWHLLDSSELYVEVSQVFLQNTINVNEAHVYKVPSQQARPQTLIFSTVKLFETLKAKN